MMTRKDYVETAEIFNRNLKYETDKNAVHAVLLIARDMASMFTRDNPKFNVARFMSEVTKDIKATQKVEHKGE